MVERIARLNRPVVALHGLALEAVEHAVDQLGRPRARAKTRHGRMDLLQRLAEFFEQRPGRGKAERAGGEPPAVFAAAHQDQVFLDEQRGRDKRRLGEVALGIAGGADHLDPATGTPMGLGKCPRQVRFEQVEHFALGIARAVFLDEHGAGHFGIEPLLLGEERQEMFVDFDPVGQGKRLQPDGEQLGRAIIGRVGGQRCHASDQFCRDQAAQ